MANHCSILVKPSLANKALRFLLLPLLIYLPALSSADSFFNEHARGWFWYQEPSEKIEDKLVPLKEPSPTEQMKVYQKKIEDSLNLAILHPTEENLKTYAQNYFDVINKGQRFTDAYQMMLLRNPGFDYSLQFPINPLAQQIYEQQKEVNLQTAIQNFAKSHGFFFFFSGDCQYCHIFAPIVKNFAQKHNISVLAISMNQEKLKEFPNAVNDNGAARLFRVTALPSLFAVNPKSKEVIPIANGALSLNQLEENVLRVVEYNLLKETP